MASAPLSAAAASAARSTPASTAAAAARATPSPAARSTPAPSSSSSRAATARSRDAAAALSERRRRATAHGQRRQPHQSAEKSGSGSGSGSGSNIISDGSRRGGVAPGDRNALNRGSVGDDREGRNPFTFAPVSRTEQQRRRQSRTRSRSGSRRGGSAGGSSSRQQQHQTATETVPVVRGILHKRRDHLTYGSSAWRPRLFLLDTERKSLTYYLLLQGGDRNTSAAPATPAATPAATPVATPVAAASPGGTGGNHHQQQETATPPRRSLSTPSVGNVPSFASSSSSAAAPSSPSQMDGTDTAYDVTPRGVIPLRGCVVRAVDVGRGLGGGRTPRRTPRRTPGRVRSAAATGTTPGPRGGGGEEAGSNSGQLFGMVISPSSSSSQLKHDVYLAATTAEDRTAWLRHLALGCGMAVSPVPGGLPVVPSASASSLSRRISGGSSSGGRVEVGSEAVDGAADGGGVEGDDDDDENESETIMQHDDAEGEATPSAAAANEADGSKEDDADAHEEDEAPASIPVSIPPSSASTPAHPSSTTSPPPPATVTTNTSSSTPFRATSRRIFETPGAVRAESEAGSSYTASRSTTGPAKGGHPHHLSNLTSPHNSLLSLSPLLQTAVVLLAPPIILRTIRCFIPLSLLGGALPQFLLFLLLARWSIRTIVVGRYLGRPLRTGRGASALHGPVTCRIAVDLRGVLRFIGNKRDEHTGTPAAGRIGANGGGRGRGSSSTSHVSVTHIVGKAIATALSEATAELNCHHISIPVLGLEGWYERESVAVSIVSSSTQRVSTIVDADTLTVQEIADEVWRRQREREPVPPKGWDLESLSGMISHAWPLCKSVVAKVVARNFAAAYSNSTPSSSCMIFTSPDSENNEVDIEIAPLPAKGRQPMLHLFREDPCPITVVVGGVRVVERDPRNTSSHQSRRPMLSIAITFDCPGCSVAACRKLSERVQTLVQFPEMCD